MPLIAQRAVPPSETSAFDHSSAAGLRDALAIAGCVTWENFIRPQGTIKSLGNWRVDAQPPSKTKANIQIQRNGVFGQPSTAACALVPFSLHDEMQRAPMHRRAMMATELNRAINAALHGSEKSWGKVGHACKIAVWEVTGAFSS